MREVELVHAQLSALDAWQAARRQRYTAALADLTDEATRTQAATRLERLARQHAALVDRSDGAPARRRHPDAWPRVVLVGHDVTDLLGGTCRLDVVDHLLDLDSAVGVAVAEQPDAVVLGLDLPLLALTEAIEDLRTFCPGSRLAGYGGTRATAALVAESGLLPFARPRGTRPELLVAGLHGVHRVAV